MSTTIEATIVDPAERDEVPRCWTGEARGFAGRFSFSSATRPWNWMELDAEDADKLFTLLSGFVSYFNARYGQIAPSSASRRAGPSTARSSRS